MLDNVTVTYDNRILSGHQRWRAAEKAGLDTIPALIEEIDKWEAEEAASGTLVREKTAETKRHRLPVVSK